MRGKSGQIVMEMFLPAEADRFVLGKKGVSRAVDSAPAPVVSQQSYGTHRQGYNAINGIHHSTNNTGSPLKNNVFGFDLCPLKQISINTKG